MTTSSSAKARHLAARRKPLSPGLFACRTMGTRSIFAISGSRKSDSRRKETRSIITAGAGNCAPRGPARAEGSVRSAQSQYAGQRKTTRREAVSANRNEITGLSSPPGAGNTALGHGRSDLWGSSRASCTSGSASVRRSRRRDYRHARGKPRTGARAAVRHQLRRPGSKFLPCPGRRALGQPRAGRSWQTTSQVADPSD